MNMGVSIASELFQEIMMKLLGDIPGVVVAIDDVLIHAKTYYEGVTSLTECLNCIRDAGMTLNKEKCHFKVKEIDFFGLRISLKESNRKKASMTI